MSTVKYEYATENSQELNKYGQSVTTRRLRDCFFITNQRRWIWHEQEGCVSNRIREKNVNRIREKILHMSQRKLIKNMLMV